MSQISQEKRKDDNQHVTGWTCKHEDPDQLCPKSSLDTVHIEVVATFRKCSRAHMDISYIHHQSEVSRVREMIIIGPPDFVGY